VVIVRLEPAAELLGAAALPLVDAAAPVVAGALVLDDDPLLHAATSSPVATAMPAMKQKLNLFMLFVPLSATTSPPLARSRHHSLGAAPMAAARLLTHHYGSPW
jgi:hypothetical protein